MAALGCSLPGSSAHGILQARVGCWSGLPFPSPGDLPNPGIEPESLMSPALAGEFFTTSPTWQAHILSSKGLTHSLYLHSILGHHLFIFNPLITVSLFNPLITVLILSCLHVLFWIFFFRTFFQFSNSLFSCVSFLTVFIYWILNCYCKVTWVMSDSVRPHGQQPTRLLHPWDFPGKSTGVGCHCLLSLKHLSLYFSY